MTPARGEGDAPVISSAGFVSFCCWLGDITAADLLGDITSV